jgi:hypothetical protein
MAKIVPEDVVRACANRAQWQPTRYSPLLNYEPPQNLNAWQDGTSATNVFGRTKSRGDRLQTVDRQYECWISGSLTHTQNARALFDALERYRGSVYHATGVGLFSKDVRDERDTLKHLSRVHDLVNLIGNYHTATGDDIGPTEKVARQIRRRLVTLLGNIDLNWEWKSNLLGGLPVLIPASDLTGLTKAITNSETAKVCIGTLAPVAAVAIGTGISDPATEEAQDPLWKKAWEKFKGFLIKIFNGFMNWAKEKLSKLLRLDVTEIIGTLSTILNVIFSFVLKEATPFVSAAKDLAEGVYELCKDAWTRSTLSAAEDKIVTREGSFALIADGIKSGIVRRQAVAAWTMSKGAIQLGLTFVGADKIASLVLGALEFGLKMAYSYFEHSKIKAFLGEAKIMFKKVKTSTVKMWEEGIDWAIASADISKANFTPGYMPPFKAINYTYDEFLANTAGAYLNFLHSAAQTSPILAAVIMNSGIVTNHQDIFHVATSHSEADDKVAKDYLTTLKSEALRLYKESTFRVIPARVMDFQDSEESDDNTWYQIMLNNAKGALQPEPFTLSV